MKKLIAILLSLLAFPAYASIIPSIPYTFTNGSVADATQVNSNFSTIQTDVNSNAAKAGANSDITSLTGLTTPLADTYGGTVVYTGGTTAGSANAQTLATLVPSNFALTAGNIVTGIAGYTNTGATTFNANGTGATAVDIEDGAGLHALSGGEIYTGNSYTFYYDGTEWILLNPSVITASNIPSTLALPNGVTATTQSASDNSTKVATTAYVDGAKNWVKTVKIQTFTSSGTYTPCTGLIYAEVKLVAAGGNGGSGNGAGAGAGGGGGECRIGIFSASTIGASQTVTLGAVGNNSTFGSLLTAVFGSTGGSYSSTPGVAGGAGGTGGSGGYGIPGQAGGFGSAGQDSYYVPSGYGGNSCLGYGAPGLVSAGTGNSAAANSGGGGSGGGGYGGSGSGGSGGTGRAIITEYCDQ